MRHTHAVGQGCLPVLSAHGVSDEHESFQPAQSEYTGEPHEGQNCWEDLTVRHATVLWPSGDQMNKALADLVSPIPVNHAPGDSEQSSI